MVPVSDILNVDPNDIAPAPTLEPGGKCSFLNGIVTNDDEMVAVIDLDCIVAKD